MQRRIRKVITEIEPRDSIERFRGLGVEVITGEGRFTGPDAFRVDGRRLSARRYVIATGSRPAIPPVQNIQNVPYLTNRSIFDSSTSKVRSRAF